ncbi:CHAT domain-containing protein [Streptomyces sp. NPDC057697]|uniref:CHAT domain-containing protein n=1 Tax=Streptomyces sp. NPDC057697 TaxID=3346219 RepID=UPI0036BC8ECF
MRLSRPITGWAFLAEVDGARVACLAVGAAALSPVTTGDGAGGSLFTRAHAWGLPVLLSLDELPLGGHPVDPRWCVARDDTGVFSVHSPDGALFAHDLGLDVPPGWRETAESSGSVVLVVSHVLPIGDDPVRTLTDETRQGMVCAGPVRFGEPGGARAGEDGGGEGGERGEGGEHGERGEHGEHGERKVRFLIDPVGVLMELAQSVCDRVLSLDEAKRRACAMERTRQDLAEHGTGPAPTAATMVDLLFREEFFDPRGLVEFMYVYWRLVTEVADACGREAAWRTAALRTVESAAPLLADRCERAVYEEADAVAARLVDALDDPAEQEAALLAAARLRTATRGPEDLAADDYARGGDDTWSARWTAELYRTWHTDEEPLQADSPRLMAEAAHLMEQALELDGGTRRPRLLASLAQILGGGRGIHPESAGAALSALLDSPDPMGEPDLVLFLLRVVEEVPPETVGQLSTAVFGTPLADFVAAHGSTTTARAISQGINLARERADRPLLRTVLDRAERLGVRWDSAHRRQLAEARLHVLPDDPLGCPGPGQALPESFPESWTPAQRSAALLHMAAHARERRQPALGLTLLREANGGRGEEVRLLTADLYRLAADTGEPGPGPVPFPWGYRTYAALAYASLGFEELARASLVPFVQQLGDLRGEELRNALYATIVDVPNFDTSGAPELGKVLRDLVHSAVWTLVAESATLPMALMLGLHQAGKGAQLGAWRRIDGPLAPPSGIEHVIGRLRDLEQPTADAGPANLLDVLDADRRPDGRDSTQLVRNLRRRISSSVDEELRRRSAPFVDDQHLWAKVPELLDDRTVLLTWFLPMAVRGAAVLLAVTRQGRELVVHLGEDAEPDDDRHPVADLVEAVRTEVERDPLFADVTPEGLRLLESGGLPLGGDLWATWRDRGKNRVLAWPHGALHYLPLALCRTGGRTIADDWTVTTIAGLEALVPAEGPARPRRTAVLASAAGGVPYGLHAEAILEEHARRVAEVVGAEAVTGPGATRDRLLAELSTADVVHIAVHGTSDHDAPWMHCLYLTPDGDDDGRVFAYDVLAADLRGIRLVTLAACESGLGRFDRADNIRGIPSALITAGAGAVVGCLWPVRPEPATYFHHRLHLRIAHGADPEQAFRDAQLATRARYPHYRDWGSFTYLHGRSEGAGE